MNAPTKAPGPVQTDPAAVVRTMFDSFGKGLEATESALRAALHEDIVMEQPGLPTVTGVEALVQLTAMLAAALDFEAVEVEIRNMAASGAVVLVERIDHMRRADGEVVGSYPVTGVLEFDGAKARTWREYFDTRELFRLLPPELVTMLNDEM